MMDADKYCSGCAKDAAECECKEPPPPASGGYDRLTDEQCNEFRRLPCSFNDMVRAIYQAGYTQSMSRIDELYEYVKHDSWRCAYGECQCGLDTLTHQMGLPKTPTS